MSYDLFFIPAEPLTRERFDAYFASRAHFRLDPDGATYENEDTGVYFHFIADADGRPKFNMNYGRPSPFGLEAAAEVAAFIETFTLGIFDPQSGGMDEGPFTEEAFLDAWSYNNALSVQLIRDQYQVQFETLCGADIRLLWRWNRQCRKRSVELGLTVPMVHSVRVCLTRGELR
ncbi:MAG: hypothetical protein AAGA56_16700 [Myxococcota bacterium]